MPTISVKDFSCISHAEMDIRRVNVVIGPQGSGKSVITKLIYFMNDIIPRVLSSAEDGMSLGEFKKSIERSFTVWFPPQAWGDKRFLINFSNGKFNARIMRRKIAGKLSDEVSLKLSSWSEEIFQKTQQSFNQLEKRMLDNDSDEEFSATSPIEIASRVRSSMWRDIRQTSEADIVGTQTFIPAGRAFFTSIGRMVAGLEQGVSLDPATLKFARLFANWRDRSGYVPLALRDSDFQSQRKKVMTEFFDGVVQSKRDSEYIEMKDGRKVPFSSLSSGQQELLPIWYFLDITMAMDMQASVRGSRMPKRPTELVYIEEPEAHLFPRAQCHLLDVLVSKVTSGSLDRKMLLTTHSPYIMSRLNVLLKAGGLAKKKKRNKALGEIVPRDAWLRLEDFSAFKIEGGKTHSIIDEEEGLIDAAFLDSISDVISEDFGKLLDLEDEI